MDNKIEIIGLSIDDLSHNLQQYRLLTSCNGKLHDYIFTPILNQYRLRISPTVIQEVQFKPISPITLMLVNGDLTYTITNSTYVVFSNGELNIHRELFQEKPIYTTKHHILVIHGNPDDVMPFLDQTKSIVYANTWDKVPHFIPEDIVVINDNQFTLEDIVLRLPKNVTVSSIVLEKVELDN